MEVCATRGFRGATLRRIAAAAGVSTPVVYDHFASKQELQIVLLERATEALIAHTTASLAKEDTESAIRARVDAFFGFVEAHPYAWRMLFYEVPEDPEVVSMHRRATERATAAIASLFAELQLRTPASVGRSQAEEMLAQAARAAVNGLASWWWDHQEVPREALTTIALDLMWTGLEQLTQPPSGSDARSS